MANTAEMGSIQEAFALALKQSLETVTTLRKRRGPEESVVVRGVTHNRRRNSQMQVSVMGGVSDFQATLLLVRRLSRLAETHHQTEIVCLDQDMQFQDSNNTSFTCSGLQAFWTRAGKEPPPIRYTNEPLPNVLDTNPVAIFMRPKDAPTRVSGYIRVVLEDPHVCLLLRSKGGE